MRNQKEFMVDDTTEKHTRRALYETQGLVASFTGKETLDNLKTSLRRLMKRIDKDQESSSFLHDLKEFLVGEGYEGYSEADLRKKVSSFVRRGNVILEDYRYAEEVEDLLDDMEEAMENIRNDEFVQVMRHHAGLVATDLTYTDSDGQSRVDLDMISKLRTVVAPYIAELLKYIPVPRMEGADASKTYWVDDIVLCGYDVIPENIRFEVESATDFSIRDIETKQADTKLIIHFRNIKTQVKDMEFFFQRKSFPALSEHGRVTILLGGAGASMTMVFRITQGLNEAFPRFVDGKADFNISKLDVQFDKSTLKHNVLVPLMTNMLKGQIKKNIETEVERNVSKLLNSIGDKLTDALIQANRPLMTGIGNFRQTMKGSDMGQIYEKRREKLE